MNYRLRPGGKVHAASTYLARDSYVWPVVQLGCYKTPYGLFAPSGRTSDPVTCKRCLKAVGRKRA